MPHETSTDTDDRERDRFVTNGVRFHDEAHSIDDDEETWRKLGFVSANTCFHAYRRRKSIDVARYFTDNDQFPLESEQGVA